MEKNKQDGVVKNKIMKKTGIVLLWLVIWQLVTWCVGNRILLAGPLDTVKAWANSVREQEFVLTCLYSVGRVGLGILLGIGSGALLGCLGYRLQFLRELLEPLMTLFKSVPVAAFVVLLLIWWGAKGLSVAVVFIVVLPLIYTNVLQGLMATDKKMLEMARVFGMTRWKRFFYIYRPALGPFMESALKIGLGMSWKAGVAAEVIGTPEFSIGEQMYLSKIYLDTAGLFAWTATVILLSVLFEKTGLYLWKKFCLWKPGLQTAKQTAKKAQRKKQPEIYGGEICLKGIGKCFEGKEVFANINQTLKPAQVYCLMAPSGKGKTTLLRILAGMEKADEGEILYNGMLQEDGIRCSYGFQEERLVETLTAPENMMILPGMWEKKTVQDRLEKLLPKDSLQQACSTFSGGMKRRVELARAVMAESELLLLDEPFAGLDEENKRRAAAYLIENKGSRIVVVATHDVADVDLLSATLWKM